MKKKVALGIGILLVLVYIAFNIISYADVGLTVHLEAADSNGIGYGISNPKQRRSLHMGFKKYSK